MYFVTLPMLVVKPKPGKVPDDVDFRLKTNKINRLRFQTNIYPSR